MGTQLCWTSLSSLLLVVILTINIFYTSARTCDNTEIGNEDAPAFDLISAFNFDDYKQIPGLRPESGSIASQRAYRITRRTQANYLSLPTSQVFPDGFPKQFTFIVTYKMASKTRSEHWDLLDVQDDRGQTQFSVRFDGKQREIHVLYLDNYGEISIAKFNKKEVRNAFLKQWHKIFISFADKQATLVIDCENTYNVPLANMATIGSTGQMVIGQSQKERTVMFDLQWMVIHCDPSKASRPNCAEIKPVSYWSGYQADKVQ